MRVRPYLVLATCCLSLFLVMMDVTIVNVALPAIGVAFHASTEGLQWVIDGYTLVIASFLMLAGSTADRIGRRRTFQVGLGLFGCGSLTCSLAPTLQTLVACRMLQAVGGAMLNPIAMSIITNTFTDLKKRARAIGVWGAVVGIAMAIGPLLGGMLVEHVGGDPSSGSTSRFACSRSGSPRASSPSRARRAHAEWIRSANCSSSCSYPASPRR